MEKRFKVGDIITNKNFPGSKLKIVKTDDSFCPYYCDVLETGEPSQVGDRLIFGCRRWVLEKNALPWVDPDKKQKRPQPDEVVVIKRFGDRTEARSSALAKTVTIKRYKDDPHSMHKACIYALDKLFDGDGINVTINSRYYTGVVACVACETKAFDPGQLYSIKNGILLHPIHGSCPIMNPYESFEDLCKRNSRTKFMEVHL